MMQESHEDNRKMLISNSHDDILYNSDYFKANVCLAQNSSFLIANI